MPFRKEQKFRTNWFIRNLVEAAWDRHAEDGKVNEFNLVYLGDVKRIEQVVYAFEQSANELDVKTARLRAKLSCTNGYSEKWHVVSLYQTERMDGGISKQILEATWCAKQRIALPELVNQIRESFGGLVESNPKYGRAPVEFVKNLHGY